MAARAHLIERLGLSTRKLEPRLRQVQALGPNGTMQIAYAEWGEASAARTVICVHGFTRNSRDFDFLARALVSKGFRVVAADLPGRGRSQWLKSPLYYTSRTMLSAMTAVIARLDVQDVDWIGTSMGGYVGMKMAARQGSPIRRLVLNDFGAQVPAAAFRRIANSSGKDPRFSNIDEAEAYLSAVLAPFGKLSRDQWCHLTTHSVMPLETGGFRLNFDPAIITPFALPLLTDLLFWHLWDRIDCPVLIVRGEASDFLLRETVMQMQKRGIAAKRNLVRAAEFAECGHAPALMSPKQTDVIAEYLLQPDDEGQ